MDKQSIVLLILNGKGAGNELLRTAVALLRKEGWRIEVRVTWERGDGLRYVNEALSLDVSTVIAGGGDGTLNEIVTALIALPAGKRPVMGILPLGTANDFATSAGIPLAMENALRLALVSKLAAIDVVRVNHSHYFINMATGGFGTRITSETPEKLKMALGGLSYFLHGLIRMDTLKADKCEISAPDFYWQGDALVIGIGNGRQAGGGQLLCPHALINDNQLDLSIVTLQEGVPLLLNTLFGGDDDNPNIIRAKLTSLTLHAPHTMTFNLDGEPLTGTDFHFEVIANAIHCRLPPSCELLA